MRSHLVNSCVVAIVLHVYTLVIATALNANYWTIRTVFIALTTSWLDESVPVYKLLIQFNPMFL